MPESAEQTGATGGAVSASGDGAADKSAGVDLGELSSKVAESLKADIASMITGAVTRNVEKAIASKFDGVDVDALKGLKSPAPKGVDKDKVDPLKSELAEVKSRLDIADKERQTYKARALSGEITKAVHEARVHQDSRELLVEHLSRVAKEESETGRILIPVKDSLGNDLHRPLSEYLGDYLKQHPALVESSARSGTGAQNTPFTGPKPTSKADLLYELKEGLNGQKKKVATPARRDAYIAQYGQAAYNALPTLA